MKNLLFWWGVLFAVVFGCAVLVKTAFGQDAPPVVELQPLINLDAVFEPLEKWCRDMLKEYWVFILTMSFTAFFFWVAFALLCGYLERQVSIRRTMENVRAKQELVRFNQESKREAHLRDLRESRYVERLEADYHSRELNKMVVREGESLRQSVAGEKSTSSVSFTLTVRRFTK